MFCTYFLEKQCFYESKNKIDCTNGDTRSRMTIGFTITDVCKIVFHITKKLTRSFNMVL